MRLLRIFYVFIVFFTSCSTTFAFNAEFVHPDINENATTLSLFDSYLINILGFEEGTATIYDGIRASQYFRFGGETEDRFTRPFKHFHDPLQPWEDAGLSWPIVARSTSALIWAQNWDGDDPASNQEDWFEARVSFEQALTTGEEAYYAKTFQTLGQLMHLVSDMAVPAHIRNDMHPLAATPALFSERYVSHFEIYTAKQAREQKLNYNGELFKPPVEIFSHFVNHDQANVPISALWDIDEYTGDNPEVTLKPIIGLAEYTNANFFSEDTIFWDYPNPATVDTNYVDTDWKNLETIVAEDGETDSRIYIYKYLDSNKTVKSHRLAGMGYFSLDHIEAGYINPHVLFILDDVVYQDYADKLVPRAVGYSAALLDYFFRGRIDIQEPRLTIGSDSSITGISCSIKNTTPPIDADQSVEPFASGSIELVYSYTTEETDANGEIVKKKHYENIGKIYPESGLSITGPNDSINYDYVDVTADLSGTPVPAGAYDISFTLVFNGTLGDEVSAVVAQIYSFENSRIAYYHQSGGQPNTSNVITISPDGSFPFQMTNATEPNPWFFSPTWSKDGAKMAFEDHSCIEVDNDGFCPMDDYVRDIVIVDLLSEEAYPGNVLSSINNNGDPVANPSFSPDGNEIVALAMNTDNPIVQFSNIVRLDIQNGTATQLTQYDPEVTDLLGSTPAWSPKGDEIAYHIYRVFNDASRSWDIKNDIMTISTEGGVSRALTNDQYINIQPSWSPDGAWIAFSSDRDGESSMDIWLMDKDGNNLTQLVDCTPASCYRPTFSPDGRFVAFSNGSEIYTVNVYGELQHITEIASLGLETGGLVWSPYLVPPSLIVEAEPRIIVAGSPSVLSWQSTRATEVSVSGVAEKQPANGNVVVYPDTTTTYTLTAAGPTGVKETSITITVQ